LVGAQGDGQKRAGSRGRGVAGELSQAAGDWIFYSSYGKPDTTAEVAVVNGNLWKALPAVKDGHGARVDDEVWFLGLGPLGAMDVPADLEQQLS